MTLFEFIQANPLWLLFAGVLTEICRHLFLIKIRKKSPNKVASFIARAIFVSLVWWFLERHSGRPWYWTMPCYIMAAWFPHDTIIAKSLGHPWWYLNKTGPLDKFQRSTLGGETSWFQIKIIAFGALVAGYFYNDFAFIEHYMNY